MRTFVHPLPKAWIYLVKKYGESNISSLKDCPDRDVCKNVYKNIEEACDGKRLFLRQSANRPICPCIIDPDNRRKLIQDENVHS